MGARGVFDAQGVLQHVVLGEGTSFDRGLDGTWSRPRENPGEVQVVKTGHGDVVGPDNEKVIDTKTGDTIAYRQVKDDHGRRLSQPTVLLPDGVGGWKQTSAPVDVVSYEAWLAGANQAHDTARTMFDIAGRSDVSIPEPERLTHLGTEELKELLGGTPDDMRAALYEAVRRTKGVSLRWTQLAAGGAFERGDVVNMAAGEGKSYLFLMSNALEAAKLAKAGQGGAVHMHTTRDVLAEQLEPDFRAVMEPLGYAVHRLNSDHPPPPPKEGQPTVYLGTSQDAAFTLLKHGSVGGRGDDGAGGGSGPGFHAEIDEIDEALVYSHGHYILSEGTGADAAAAVADPIKGMREFLSDKLASGELTEADFGREPDTVGGPAQLTQVGVAKATALLNPHGELAPAQVEGQLGKLNMAGAAHWEYVENVHYVIDDKTGKLYIIDQTTHQVLYDPRTSSESRWNGGLAQALEAKHGLAVRHDSDGDKKVTSHGLYEKYAQVVGASGTANGKNELFAKQGLSSQIADISRYYRSGLSTHDIEVSANLKDKLATIAGDVAQMQELGDTARPQLILAHRNDLVAQISAQLGQRNVAHVAIDAKWFLRQGVDRDEAFKEVVAQAGKPGAVLVINMQGARGVDIPLDDHAKALGGLHVVVTGHSGVSKDIDIQAENRAARSGDRGSVKYYISPDDDLFRLSDNPQVQLAVIQYRTALHTGTDTTPAQQGLRDAVPLSQNDAALRMGIRQGPPSRAPPTHTAPTDSHHPGDHRAPDRPPPPTNQDPNTLEGSANRPFATEIGTGGIDSGPADAHHQLTDLDGLYGVGADSDEPAAGGSKVGGPGVEDLEASSSTVLESGVATTPVDGAAVATSAGHGGSPSGITTEQVAGSRNPSPLQGSGAPPVVSPAVEAPNITQGDGTPNGTATAGSVGDEDAAGRQTSRRGLGVVSADASNAGGPVLDPGAVSVIGDPPSQPPRSPRPPVAGSSAPPAREGQLAEGITGASGARTPDVEVETDDVYLGRAEYEAKHADDRVEDRSAGGEVAGVEDVVRLGSLTQSETNLGDRHDGDGDVDPATEVTVSPQPSSRSEVDVPFTLNSGEGVSPLAGGLDAVTTSAARPPRAGPRGNHDRDRTPTSQNTEPVEHHDRGGSPEVGPRGAQNASPPLHGRSDDLTPAAPRTDLPDFGRGAGESDFGAVGLRWIGSQWDAVRGHPEFGSRLEAVYGWLSPNGGELAADDYRLDEYRRAPMAQAALRVLYMWHVSGVRAARGFADRQRGFRLRGGSESTGDDRDENVATDTSDGHEDSDGRSTPDVQNRRVSPSRDVEGAAPVGEPLRVEVPGDGWCLLYAVVVSTPPLDWPAQWSSNAVATHAAILQQMGGRGRPAAALKGPAEALWTMVEKWVASRAAADLPVEAIRAFRRSEEQAAVVHRLLHDVADDQSRREWLSTAGIEAPGGAAWVSAATLAARYDEVYAERRAAGEDEPLIRAGHGGDGAESSEMGLTVPELRFNYLQTHGGLPRLADLGGVDLALMIDGAYAQLPLTDEEYAGLLGSLGSWDTSWATSYGEMFPSLVAHTLGVHLQYGSLGGVNDYGVPDGPVVQVHHNGDNHYQAIIIQPHPISLAAHRDASTPIALTTEVVGSPYAWPTGGAAAAETVALQPLQLFFNEGVKTLDESLKTQIKNHAAYLIERATRRPWPFGDSDLVVVVEGGGNGRKLNEKRAFKTGWERAENTLEELRAEFNAQRKKFAGPVRNVVFTAKSRGSAYPEGFSAAADAYTKRGDIRSVVIRISDSGSHPDVSVDADTSSRDSLSTRLSTPPPAAHTGTSGGGALRDANPAGLPGGADPGRQQPTTDDYHQLLRSAPPRVEPAHGVHSDDPAEDVANDTDSGDEPESAPQDHEYARRLHLAGSVVAPHLGDGPVGGLTQAGVGMLGADEVLAAAKLAQEFSEDLKRRYSHTGDWITIEAEGKRSFNDLRDVAPKLYSRYPELRTYVDHRGQPPTQRARGAVADHGPLITNRAWSFQFTPKNDPHNTQGLWVRVVTADAEHPDPTIQPRVRLVRDALEVLDRGGYLLGSQPLEVVLPRYTKKLRVSITRSGRTFSAEDEELTDEVLQRRAEMHGWFIPPGTIYIAPQALIRDVISGTGIPEITCLAMRDVGLAIVVHEMMHWLHYVGNPRLYTDLGWTALRRPYVLAALTAGVSRYATHHPFEFVAEYGLGRAFGRRHDNPGLKEVLDTTYSVLGGARPSTQPQPLRAPKMTDGRLAGLADRVRQYRGGADLTDPQVRARYEALVDTMGPWAQYLSVGRQASLIADQLATSSEDVARAVAPSAAHSPIRRVAAAQRDVLADESWRHSPARSADWFDPDRRPVRPFVLEGLRSFQTPTRVNTTGSVNARAIEYDWRRIAAPSGRFVQDFTLNVHLRTGPGYHEIDAILMRVRIQDVASRVFNLGYRLPSGDEFHVTVEVTDHPERAPLVVDVGEGHPAQQHRNTKVSDGELAADMLRHLGVADEPSPGSDSHDDDSALRPRHLWMIERTAHALGVGVGVGDTIRQRQRAEGSLAPLPNAGGQSRQPRLPDDAVAGSPPSASIRATPAPTRVGSAEGLSGLGSTGTIQDYLNMMLGNQPGQVIDQREAFGVAVAQDVADTQATPTGEPAPLVVEFRNDVQRSGPHDVVAHYRHHTTTIVGTPTTTIVGTPTTTGGVFGRLGKTSTPPQPQPAASDGAQGGSVGAQPGHGQSSASPPFVSLESTASPIGALSSTPAPGTSTAAGRFGAGALDGVGQGAVSSVLGRVCQTPGLMAGLGVSDDELRTYVERAYRDLPDSARRGNSRQIADALFNQVSTGHPIVSTRGGSRPLGRGPAGPASSPGAGPSTRQGGGGPGLLPLADALPPDADGTADRLAPAGRSQLAGPGRPPLDHQFTAGRYASQGTAAGDPDRPLIGSNRDKGKGRARSDIDMDVDDADSAAALPDRQHYLAAVNRVRQGQESASGDVRVQDADLIAELITTNLGPLEPLEDAERIELTVLLGEYAARTGAAGRWASERGVVSPDRPGPSTGGAIPSGDGHHLGSVGARQSSQGGGRDARPAMPAGDRSGASAGGGSSWWDRGGERFGRGEDSSSRKWARQDGQGGVSGKRRRVEEGSSPGDSRSYRPPLRGGAVRSQGGSWAARSDGGGGGDQRRVWGSGASVGARQSSQGGGRDARPAMPAGDRSGASAGGGSSWWDRGGERFGRGEDSSSRKWARQDGQGGVSGKRRRVEEGSSPGDSRSYRPPLRGGAVRSQGGSWAARSHGGGGGDQRRVWGSGASVGARQSSQGGGRDARPAMPAGDRSGASAGGGSSWWDRGGERFGRGEDSSSRKWARQDGQGGVSGKRRRVEEGSSPGDSRSYRPPLRGGAVRSQGGSWAARSDGGGGGDQRRVWGSGASVGARQSSQGGGRDARPAMPAGDRSGASAGGGSSWWDRGGERFGRGEDSSSRKWARQDGQGGVSGKRRRVEEGSSPGDSRSYRPPRGAGKLWSASTAGAQRYEARILSRQLKDNLRDLGGRAGKGGYSPQQRQAITRSAQHFLNSGDAGPMGDQLPGYAGLANEWSKNLEDQYSREALHKVAAKFGGLPPARTESAQRDRARDLALLANAFSKLDLDEYPDARRALGQIAAHVADAPDLRIYLPRYLANLANGFSKLNIDQSRDGRRGLETIAAHVATADLRAYLAHDLANLANGFSKLNIGASPVGVSGLEAIAARVAGADLKDYLPQGLANLANGFSKLNIGASPVGVSGLETIAAHVADAPDLRDYLPQHLANLANGFSKLDLDESRDGRRGLEAIAAHVAGADLAGYLPQQLANLANGFSKLNIGASPVGVSGLETIAAHVATADLAGYLPQHLANLANGLSKLNIDQSRDGRRGLETIAAHIAGADLAGYLPQQLANLANGFSKLNIGASPVGVSALEAIAARVAGADLEGYLPQDLANLANGFSKLNIGASPVGVSGLETIAAHVADAPDLAGYLPQHLANLANGFSKLDLDESRDGRRGLEAIAAHIAGADLAGYLPQHLANLANGLSKLNIGASPVGVSGLEAIAAHVAGADLAGYLPQELANVANGLSKLNIGESADGRRGLEAIAARVATADLAGYLPQHLAIVANGLSKLNIGESPVGVSGLEAIAARVAGADLAGYLPQELAIVANGLSKLNIDESRDGRRALGEIAAHVADAPDLRDYLPQGLANLANGLSKLNIGESRDGRRGLEAIAAHVADAPDLAGYLPQHLANVANGLSKLNIGASPVGVSGLEAIAARVAGADLAGYLPQHLANLANGLSKLNIDQSRDGRRGLEAIAAHVAGADLAGYLPQDLANVANGLSKLNIGASPVGVSALEAIAARVAGADLAGYLPQELANLANGFSKLNIGASPVGVSALETIAARVAGADLAGYLPQHLANLANGLSRLNIGESRDGRRGLETIASKVGWGVHWFGAFDVGELGQLANALSRGWMAVEGDVQAQALFAGRLHRLADHWGEDPGRLQQAAVLDIAILFKALVKVRLYDDLRVLGGPGVDRLAQLRGNDDLAGVNLETLGNLSVALLPLVRSLLLRRHRAQTLEFLVKLQPVIAQKMDLYRGQVPASPGQQFSTRWPALTMFQILKTYDVVATMVARRTRTSTGFDAGPDNDLRAWLDVTLYTHRKLIEDDLSSHSWNLIAQLEAENPLDALDGWLQADHQHAGQSQPLGVPASFALAEVFEQMRHEPGAPPADAGRMRMARVDLRGKPIPATHQDLDVSRYSILSRLTESKLAPVGVQLPGKLSAFMLGRMLEVNGVPHRMDLFGGSAMKTVGDTLQAIFAREPGQKRVINEGRLLAFPLADTRHDSSFAGLMAKLLPNQESYYYFQRMMIASPPGIAGLEPRDYVLEGSFPIAILPDRRPEESHPFALRDGIALRPHDGTGFIKESVAHTMGLFGKTPGKLPIFAERPAKLPAQALQYYPRSGEVVAEAVEKLRPTIAAGKTSLQGEELFRTVTAGNIEGAYAVAVPSSDAKLHLPAQKTPDRGADAAGVLLGRAPYDKPNLRPIEPSRVGEPEDATAKFLTESTAIQYSFVGAESAAAGQTSEAPLFFAKGLLVVVPDAKWPPDYADRSVVFSAEDIKTHSDWVTKKDRHTRDTRLVATGILQATEVFGPGSLAAVPVDEHNKLDGDFDGDAVIVLANRPALFDHVQKFEQEYKPLVLKPPKSHTPAINPHSGRYEFGRGRQILSIKLGILQSYSGLQQTYLAQSSETRRWIAERAVFGTYEGLDATVKKQLRQALEQEGTITSWESLMSALDEEFNRTQNLHTKKMIAMLRDQLRAWRADPAPTPHDTAGGFPPPFPAPALLARKLATVEEAAQQANTAPVRQQIEDDGLLELFPKLEEVNQARTTAERIEAILNGFPSRMDIDPNGYNPQDLTQSLQNFLSLGIKAGTDAYKSDTGTYAFKRKADRLSSLFASAPDLHRVPYAKAAARSLHAGKFNPDTERQILKNNPTLAAGLMEAALDLAEEHHLLAKSTSPDNQPDLALERHADANARAQALHTQARENEPNITPFVQSVAQQQHTQLFDENKQLRSITSMRDELAAPNTKPGKTPEKQVHNALRYVMVFPEETFTENSRQALGKLQRFFIKMRVKNYFLDKQPTFRGVSAVLATEEGFTFAVQFHTPASYQAKNDNHDTHKNIQQEVRQTHPDLTRLQDYRGHLQKQYAQDKVPLPEHIKLIHDFAPLHGLDVHRGGMHGRGDGTIGPAPSGSGERPNKSDAGASAQKSTRPQPLRNVLPALPHEGKSAPAQPHATDARAPSAGLADVADRNPPHPAVARVHDRLPGDVDLDHQYGPLVGPSWIKPEEKDEKKEMRINPVWYRLSDMPPEVMSLHTDAKWHYTVDADGHIRIGSAELGTMLSTEELTQQYGYHHRGQQPTAEQLEEFRQGLNGLGHPTIAVEFGAHGQIANGNRQPRARISGEIIWNHATKTWEINYNSGRYMRGKRTWSMTRKPTPTDEQIRRWLDNVAARLTTHLGTQVTTAAKRR